MKEKTLNKANEYRKQFNKDNYKNVAIRIRKEETAVLNKLESVPSKNAYIIGLIKKDIKKL